MTALLTIAQAQKRFGGLVAVQDVSLTVAEGEVLGLLGPNGSGKSTLLNLISGAAQLSSGEIRLRGAPIGGLVPERIAHMGVSRTFQLVRLAQSLTALENVKLALAFGRPALWGHEADERARQALAQVGLSAVRTLAGDLNYIDQKRVELARAIVTRPRLLLLDEWLSGLNPTEMRESIALVESLARSGMTIILVEHIMEAVRRLCPRVVVMASGRVIADGPTLAALAQPEVVAAYLGGDDV